MSETEKKRVVIEFDSKGAKVVQDDFSKVAKGSKSAKKEVQGMRLAFGKATSAVKAMGKASVTAFNYLKKGVSIVLAPLKLALKLMVSMKMATLALGLSSIKAAAQYEAMKTTLISVTLNAKKAKAAFKESIDFSVQTPYTPKEIIQTRTRLESIGIRGNDPVKAVGEVAAAMNRSIEDVALGVISMETEVLRKLGVQVKKEGELFKFGFESKAGEAIQMTATGLRNAQETLLNIFAEKYEGGLERLSTTTKGLWSTLVGAFDDLKAAIGAGFAPQIKQIMRDLLDVIAKVKESFSEKFGAQIAKTLDSARAHVIAMSAVLGNTFKAMNDTAKDKGIGYVILESLKLGGELAGTLFIEAMKASLSIWEAIGHTIGQSMYNFLLTTDLPFAQGTQKRQAGSDLQAMSNKDKYNLHQSLNLGPAKENGQWVYIQELIDEVQGGNREVMGAILSQGGKSAATEKLTREMGEMTTELRESGKRLGDAASTRFQEFGGKMGVEKGPSYQEVYSQNVGSTIGKTEAKPKAATADVEAQITMMDRLNDQWTRFDGSIKAAFTTLKKEGDETRRVFGGEFVKSFKEWEASAIDITDNVGTLVSSTMQGFTEETRKALFEGTANWRAFGQAVVEQLQTMVVEMGVAQATQFLQNVGKSLLPVAAEAGAEATAEIAKEASKRAADQVAETAKNAATTVAITTAGQAAAGAMGLAITTAGQGAAGAMALAISTASTASSGAQAAGGIAGAVAGASQFGTPSTKGTPYLVGEQRAEMVIPPIASRIVPNPSVNEGANGGNYDGGTQRMIVTTDQGATEQWLRTPAGEKAVMRIMTRNGR